MAMKPKDVQIKMKSAYGFDISYKVAWKAKQKARDMIYGPEVDSFNMLSWFREAVLASNPGFVFVLEVDPSTNQFQRLFLAYAYSIEGFRYCLLVLYVDGTFGKSIFKGTVLCAIGRTGNKGCFPFAMCVCDSESEDNWSFFFTHLKDLLEPQGRAVTFMSDRGIGLLSSFKKVFPGHPHLFCYKHLSANLLGKYGGVSASVKASVKKKFFELAYASSAAQYRLHLRSLREIGGENVIDNFLKDLPVENWCRAFFPGSRYGIMANSMTESFNAWFSEECELPAYGMLDQTRVKLMKQKGERRDAAQLWTTPLTPIMQDQLKERMEVVAQFNVVYSPTNIYEVRGKYSHVVDLGICSCTCRKWEIEYFTCSHALVVIQAASKDVYDFIDPHFFATYCRKCYDVPLFPLCNADTASLESANDDYTFPLNLKRPPGRPRKKRFKSSGETEKKLIRCGRCQKLGNHNKATCTEPL